MFSFFRGFVNTNKHTNKPELHEIYFQDMCMCVYVCVYVSVFIYVCVCVCVCVRARARARVCKQLLDIRRRKTDQNPANKSFFDIRNLMLQ